MIELNCACGQKQTVEEDQAGNMVVCPDCGGRMRLVCAEALEPGAGMGDFDASLLIQQGPQRKGERFLLGGVADIVIGKQAPIFQLQGAQVSRQHCLLRRKDFGPSRWAIVDNNSTNGLFVNGQRVKEAQLNPGDEVQIGEYLLRYDVDSAASAELAELAEPVMAAASATLPPLPPPPPPPAAHLPPVPAPRRSTMPPSAGKSSEPKAPSNDGWSRDETQFNKIGTYLVLGSSIIAAILASGFLGVEIPVGVLCVIVGLCGIGGGIINLWGRGPLWAGAIIGLVMAMGGFGAVAWWIAGREYVRKYELTIAFIVGALPGFGLQKVLQKVLAR